MITCVSMLTIRRGQEDEVQGVSCVDVARRLLRGRGSRKRSSAGHRYVRYMLWSSSHSFNSQTTAGPRMLVLMAREMICHQPLRRYKARLFAAISLQSSLP